MKFSVIVPIYNCEKYLVDCLNSVSTQSFTDWECICVDDGSTDRSGVIADEYARNSKRFRVVHKPNGGEGSARNAGLDVCQGEYVFFLDADDVLNNKTLEVCAKGIELYPEADISSVDLITFEAEGTPKWDNPQKTAWELYNVSNIINCKTFGISICCVAYRLESIKDIRFTDLKIGADRVYIAAVIERVQKHVCSNYVGYGYRTRVGSAVNTQMNELMFLSDLRHRMVFVDVFKHTSKEYDRRIIVRFAKDFTEYMSYCYFRMSKEDQQRCLKEWCSSMLAASKYSGWTSWQHFVLNVCGKSKSSLLIRLLCFLPYWLKLHGVNRKVFTFHKDDIP